MESVSWSHEIFPTLLEFDFALPTQNDRTTSTEMNCAKLKVADFSDFEDALSKTVEQARNYENSGTFSSSPDIAFDLAQHRPLFETYNGQQCLSRSTWTGRQHSTVNDQNTTKVKCESISSSSPYHQSPCRYNFDDSANLRNNRFPEKSPSSAKVTSNTCVKLNDPDFSMDSVSKIDSIELYHDLIMRHLMQDISSTSARLKIPADPKLWSIDHTHSWLMDTVRQYNLPPVPEEFLYIPGTVLSSISLDEMKIFYPVGAELIHAQLNLWTTASKYSSRQSDEPDVNSKEAAQRRDSRNFLNPLWSPIYFSHSQKNDKGNVTVERKQIFSQDCSNNFKKEQKLSSTMNNSLTFWNSRECSTAKSMLSPNGSDSGVSTDHDENPNNSEVNWRQMGSTLPFPSNHYFQNNNVHLWQFLRELLDHQDKYAFCVRWLDRAQGVFKIEDSHKLAKFWGQRKNRPAMNYDKLSRSLRQYCRKGILKKTPRSQRLVYQFLSPYHMR